jgi:hypothetical protein
MLPWLPYARYYVVTEPSNPVIFYSIYPIPPTSFLLLATSILRFLPPLSSSFIIILSLLTPLRHLIFRVYIAFILFHLLYYRIPLYYLCGYGIASLVDVTPGSHAVGGLGSTSAGDNSKGGSGYNIARGGPTGYQDVVGLGVSCYLPLYG